MSLARRFAAIRFLPLYCLLLPAVCWADKIYLNSGEVISGTITGETPDLVRIQVLVGTIKDNRTITRVSISRIEKTTPEDSERDACLPLKVTPDGLPLKGYEDRLKVINDFLTKYPTSKYLAEIQEIRTTLSGELDRVKAGDIRFRGNWLSPEQQVIHAYQLEANTALRIMRQAASGRNFLGALRQFEVIEKTYAGTLAFPQALTDVKRILPAYGQQLTKELEYARYDATQNAKGMAALQEGARIAAEQEIAAAAARFKAQVAAEKAKKVTWLSVDLKSEASINEAIGRIRKEMDRIGKLDPAPMEKQAQAFYDAAEQIHAGKLDEAKAALTAAASLPGGAKMSPASKAKAKTASRPTSATAATATTDRPSLLAALQIILEERIQKRANDAKLAAMAAEAEKTALKQTDAAAKDAAPEITADDALNALVMQKSAVPGGEDEAAKGAKAGAKTASTGKPSSSSKPTASRPSSSKTPAADDEDGAERPVRPRPERPAVAPKSGGSPLPIIIGLATVALVGATVFLYLQEQKKKGES
jgi:hypothetical protein